VSEDKLSFRQRAYNLRRKLFGTYEIRDPRPVAAEAPYTFYLPPQNRLELLRPGDTVKVTVASIPDSPEFDTERMWVLIDRIEGDDVYGELSNQPVDIPQLKSGAKLQFKVWNIIDYEYSDDDRDADLPDQEEKQIWDRCLVDRCVLDDGVPVEYIYREEPDMAVEDDKYPDSGWRIRGDARGISSEEMEERKAEYIALGTVLNEDDSWIHLIDSPIGSAFTKNFETGEFEEEE